MSSPPQKARNAISSRAGAGDQVLEVGPDLAELEGVVHASAVRQGTVGFSRDEGWPAIGGPRSVVR